MSKYGLKQVAEISEVRSWSSYLFMNSITCHNLLLHSTLAFSMHGCGNHEGTKNLNVDVQCENQP